MIFLRSRLAPTIGACSAGIVCVAAATGAASTQFKTGTALVVVDVVVTGEDGRPVPDLTSADFELFEDGRPRAIDQFQFLDFREPSPEAISPAGVSSNAAEPGGIFALVLDELNLSRRYTPALRRWAKQFINETLQPHDYAVVLRSGGDSGMLFTNDRAMLTMIAESAAGRSGAEATLGPDAVGQGADTGAPPARPGLPGRGGSGEAARGTAGSATIPSDPGARDAGGPSMDQDRAFVAAQGLEMLLKAVQRLGTIPSRRKAVLWFSEGVPCDIETVIAGGEGCARIGQRLREIQKAAVASNVAIYGVDPRGAPARPRRDAAAHANHRQRTTRARAGFLRGTDSPIVHDGTLHARRVRPARPPARPGDGRDDPRRGTGSSGHNDVVTLQGVAPASTVGGSARETRHGLRRRARALARAHLSTSHQADRR